MLAFVDESGDPGLKVVSGSSPFFTVAVVIFADANEAQAADDRIAQLRAELGLDPRFEFHFSKCSAGYREIFLHAVRPFGFVYHAMVINKAKLYGEGFARKESFYKYTSSLVFDNAKPLLSDATVVIDGSGSREFRQQLARYLKAKINDPDQRYLRKVKLADSAGNNLVQMADMVAGAIARSFGTKKDAGTYREIVRRREARVQFWPK